jgi:ketosteroid isomerase-like protein
MTSSSAMKIGHMQTGGNAVIVRRAYEAFNTANIATLAKLFDSNASWHTPGRSSIAGDRKGRDAVFTQFGRYGGETSGTFRANLLNVLESEDGRVVAVHHNSAERNGRRLDSDRPGALLRPQRVGRVLVVTPSTNLQFSWETAAVHKQAAPDFTQTQEHADEVRDQLE